MAVLNRQDYSEELNRTNSALDSNNAVRTILGWGDADVGEKIQKTHGEYHRGLRMNELSEEIAKRNLLQLEDNRAIMIDLCNSYSEMSIAKIDEVAARIRGLSPKTIPTHAREVGPGKCVSAFERATCGAPRSIIVLLDRSSSMTSTDAGGRSRFEVSKKCIMDIFNKNVDDRDQIGLYTFEDKVRESFPLTEKGSNRDHLTGLINNLPKPDGLTRFYDGMFECIKKLQMSHTQQNFLIALTDGDDNMSTTQPNGELVTDLIESGIPGLNLIVITCGKQVKAKTIDVLHSWTLSLQAAGSVGMHIPADSPAQLTDVFAKVGAIIDMDGESEI
jgi:Mg-chelatase subunit ChlD